MMPLSWSLEQDCLSLSGPCCAMDISLHWEQLKVMQVAQVDLGSVSQIDSAGIAAIITAFKVNDHKPLRLINCSWQAKQLLTLYGLEDFIEYA